MEEGDAIEANADRYVIGRSVGPGSYGVVYPNDARLIRIEVACSGGSSNLWIRSNRIVARVSLRVSCGHSIGEGISSLYSARQDFILSNQRSLAWGLLRYPKAERGRSRNRCHMLWSRLFLQQSRCCGGFVRQKLHSRASWISCNSG